MPAMNTPQFTWVKSRLSRLPQPVPPIYEPEVGARMVVHAALSPSPRREYWVGGSTVKAILGQKVAPGLLDAYLEEQAMTHSKEKKKIRRIAPTICGGPSRTGLRRTARLTSSRDPSVSRLNSAGTESGSL